MLQGNLLASLWWLERKFPREYALRTVNRPDPDQENEFEPEIPAEVLARHRRLYLEAAREDEAASSNRLIHEADENSG